MPFGGDFPWWRFDELLADVGPEIDDAARRGLESAVLRDVPLLEAAHDAPTVVCHGDVHPGNVIQSSEGAVLLDWDLLCRGPRAWDHAALLTWWSRWNGDPHVYGRFADGYGASLRDDPLAGALAELRLVAATLMRVRAGRSNPAAATEAASRLRYWRGEADAPQWQPQ
jgi:Ser/Thr protein kinase RdoA (MazF antagonist)